MRTSLRHASRRNGKLVESPQISLVLFREALPITPQIPHGYRAVVLRTLVDNHLETLAHAIESDGLPAGWTRHMLDQAHEAHVLLDDAGRFAGCGWIARTKYYVSEIHRSFDPGPDGDYYFGDYVAKDFRGRKLHRVLIELRIAASTAAARRWAIGMTHAQNQPSVKGYLSAGFKVALQLKTKSLGKWRLDKTQRFTPLPPGAGFSTEGVCVPLLGRLRRK